ncbi:hypothetical protein CMA01_09210 [Carnobacterium maltaromaticum]|nr:hypothetical protein CMA01_09210 [Carnobacterium maltaromaticum]
MSLLICRESASLIANTEGFIESKVRLLTKRLFTRDCWEWQSIRGNRDDG